MIVQRVFQRLLFQFHVRYLLILVRLFGVWPYIIDEKSKTVRTTWYLKLYPLAVIMFFFACVALSHVDEYDSTNIIWHSVAANLLMFLYGINFVTSFFTAFVDQNNKFKAIEALIERCHRLFTLRISKYFLIEEFSYVKLLLLYTFKSKVMIIYSVYCIITRMYLTSILHGFAVLAYFGTNYVILIIPNFFFGMVLTSYFVFKQINLKLKRISQAAISLSAGGADFKHTYRMQRFCELSDRLDELAVLHLELCKMMNSINSVASLQLMNHITLRFTSLLVQLFFGYIYVSLWTQLDQDGTQFPIKLFVNSIHTAIFNVIDLTLLVHVCHMMVVEVIILIIYIQQLLSLNYTI